MAFDAEGRLYVADTHNNRATIYELDGTEGRLVGELSDRFEVDRIMLHCRSIELTHPETGETFRALGSPNEAWARVMDTLFPVVESDDDDGDDDDGDTAS